MGKPKRLLSLVLAPLSPVLVVLCLLLGSAFLSGAHAQVAAPGRVAASFDHLSTGFELTGSHLQVRCESCHVDGVFKGTQANCAACHTAGTRVGATSKPSNHILTTERCADCHTTVAWSTAERFDHSQVVGSCSNCHNNVQVMGKPATHIPTTLDCNACHNVGSWALARFDHAGVFGNCASCHNGARATGKEANHIPVGDDCESCHTPSGWRPATFSHAGITGNCASCHDGVRSAGKGRAHIQSSMVCESCHISTAWAPVARVDHTQVLGSCVVCHNGTSSTSSGAKITGKPVGHILSTNACEACHSTTVWQPVTRVDHANVTGSCVSCHNGTIQAGKTPGVHVASTDACETCHGTTVWQPTSRVDHGQLISANCAACHARPLGGGAVQATVKSATHVASDNQCATCHSTLSWRPASFDHAGISSGCASCHNNVTATGKSGGHIVSTALCESCHVSTSVWAPVPAAQVDHTQVVGTCNSCHNGTVRTSSGTLIQGKGATHILSTAACDTCHATGSWTPTVRVDHAQVLGSCFTCHNGTTRTSAGALITGKSPTHIPSSNACENCHSPDSWATNGRPDHSTFIGNCATCHGVSASGKGLNHIQSTVACDNCHTVSSWLPAETVDHTQVLGSCTSCHSGSVLTNSGALIQGKGTNHITTALECDACHTTSAWTVARFDHTKTALSCFMPQQYESCRQDGCTHHHDECVRNLP
jgi:hypothetical protein